MKTKLYCDRRTAATFATCATRPNTSTYPPAKSPDSAPATCTAATATRWPSAPTLSFPIHRLSKPTRLTCTFQSTRSPRRSSSVSCPRRRGRRPFCICCWFGAESACAADSGHTSANYYSNSNGWERHEYCSVSRHPNTAVSGRNPSAGAIYCRIYAYFGTPFIGVVLILGTGTRRNGKQS